MSDHAELIAIVTAEGVAPDRAPHLVTALLGSAWIAHRDRQIQAEERRRVVGDLEVAGRARVAWLDSTGSTPGRIACTEETYRHAMTIAGATTRED